MSGEESAEAAREGSPLGAGTRPLRLGTRKSLMAMTQSQQVADALTARTGHAVELVGVTTQGDVSKALLAQIGGTGVFVNALRDRVLSGEVDFAVHSLKDLPTSESPGIALAATPLRDDPRDALCGPAKLADLPRGARIGTGSARRAAQLRAMRPDLEIVPIRGNADTRLRKVADGEVDAVVLAYAGLKRIRRLDAVAEVFEADQMLPAPGQGALALECRADRADLRALLETVDDPATRRAVTAERTVLAVLEGGCSAPVGAYSVEFDERLHLTATVVSYDGSRQLRLSASGHPDDAERLGRDLANRLLAQGADQLIGERD
ncbi:hydroxymethylbilane synthase [Actinomadura spongiicola]|uniref:Porphobilinogen deaminase n=1 Tax=Actinomadura spongiicola TaxID=2303421 RepID=A0A372GD81_9ACTN|nr:hydroxymethylbilane synthase [Actinomadura spongiicola]RFS83345.1 hydroxymethylbilane synthase [Actinomadura spongiicola]